MKFYSSVVYLTQCRDVTLGVYLFREFSLFNILGLAD